MRNALPAAILLAVLTAFLPSCLPTAGCMDHTAENYRPDAEESDGTCIPARDKMIGNYRYTCHWADVFLEVDSFTVGIAQITERKTANNAFLINLNNDSVLAGVISAFDIVMDDFSETKSYMAMSYNYTFSGEGEWLKNDTVDIKLTLSVIRPYVNLETNPNQVLRATQKYHYFLTKLP